ncbi:MAG: PAS domain-containing protein [Elusimicrobia bacterium]|nr:PAS domain-containing protein [Elusimicrobiota bacterium]
MNVLSKTDRILLLKIIASIFVLETVAHLLAHRLPGATDSALLDALLMALLGTPVFWFWVLREQKAQADLRRSTQESEGRYRTLVENLGTMVSLIGKDFRIAMVNAEGGRVFRKAPAVLAGKECFREFEKRDAVCPHCPGKKAMETGRPCGVETIGVRDDGTRFEVRVNAYPCFDAGGEVSGFIELVEDLTESKAAQRALRESEERFRGVVDNIEVGVALLSPNMEILSLNKRMREWFPHIDVGRRPVCYRSYNTPPRDEVCSYCPVVKTLADGEVHESVTETPTPAGIVNYRVIASPLKDAGGGILGVIELVEDVTQELKEGARLQADLLRRSRLNELLRLSLEPVPTAQKLERMLGCVLSTPWFAVERKGCVMLREGSALRMAAQIGLSDPIRAECALLPLGRCLCGRVAESGEEEITAELDERHEVSYPGIVPHGHMTLPLKGGGETLGVLNMYLPAGANLDADQREFARAAAGIISGVVLLARSEERLLHALKMDAVGKLAGGIAHDFNNILAAIKGYSEFLLNSVASGDPRHQDLLEVAKAADRGAGLTRQLLAFSRRQVLSPRPVDLNEVIQGCAKMLSCLLGAGIRLELRLEPPSAGVVVDQGQMEQCIMNLALNARDAMPEGGTLTIATANLPAGSRDVRGKAAGPVVLLSVTDTGTGMSADVLSHIFEPFFSTKPKDKGTGLGLATVYGIVKQSGGDIEVESSPGKGSVFKVTLPASAAECVPAQPPAAEAPAPLGRETLLLVEDEEAVRTVAERQLSAAGYRVFSASQGEDALKVLDRPETRVDLLVTDVIMPGLSGPELAAEALSRRPGLRVLYISGHTGGALLADDLLEEGVCLLQKPFSAGALAAEVRKILDAPPKPARPAKP